MNNSKSDHDKLLAIYEDDEKFILNTVHEIHPPRPMEIDIDNIEFYVDLDLESNEETVSCDNIKELDFEYKKIKWKNVGIR